MNQAAQLRGIVTDNPIQHISAFGAAESCGLHSMTLTSFHKYSALHVKPKSSFKQNFFMPSIIHLVLKTLLFPSVPSSSHDNFRLFIFICFFTVHEALVASSVFLRLHMDFFVRNTWCFFRNPPSSSLRCRVWLSVPCMDQESHFKALVQDSPL